jgi:hypothetical protein
MKALIYLRFANFITVGDDGNLTFSFRRRHNRPISQTLYPSQIGARTSHRTSTKLPGCFDWAKDVYDGTATSGTASASDQAVHSSHVSKHLKQVARRLMWYPICELVGHQPWYPWLIIIIFGAHSVYTLVVVPVSVCRMGVLAGWKPPFGLLVLAGICFGGSGTFFLTGRYRCLPDPLYTGVSNVTLFITTRHSFIRQVARDRGTRIRVTTERETVREGSARCLELDEIATNVSSPSLATPKSPYFPSFEGVKVDMGGMKEKTKEQNCETDIVDGSIGDSEDEVMDGNMQEIQLEI